MQEMVLRNARDPEEVGRKIRERRKALGLSQDELADRMGCDRNEIYRHENAKRDMSICTLFRYAEALETEPQALMPGRFSPARPAEKQDRFIQVIGRLSRESLETVLQMAERLAYLENRQAG